MESVSGDIFEASGGGYYYEGTFLVCRFKEGLSQLSNRCSLYDCFRSRAALPESEDRDLRSFCSIDSWLFGRKCVQSVEIWDRISTRSLWWLVFGVIARIMQMYTRKGV